MTTTDHDLLTSDETADRLRISPQTLSNWRVAGRGPRHLKIGRRVVYARSELDLWIAEQRLAPK